MSRKVIDIETNDLLQNMLDFSSLPYKLKPEARLWCISVRDVDTLEVTTLKSKSGLSITKDELQAALAGTDEIIGHNAIKFDFIALKLFGVLDYEVGYLNRPDKLFGSEVKVTDTLIRSRLLNPDRYGGHGLNAWGKRLGEFKVDFHNFSCYSDEMVTYCEQDTLVTVMVHKQLQAEFDEYQNWYKPEKLENKLADLAIRRESYGFWFDKELAVKCLEDLQVKMKTLSDRVNPILPPKRLAKTKLQYYTPPKVQILKDQTWSSNLKKFVERHGMEILSDSAVSYEGKVYYIPFSEPIKEEIPATIDDLDHVKMYLIELGWIPVEWKERDLTKDSKKQSISYEKRVAALDKWLEQTFEEGKYTKLRLKELNMGTDKSFIRAKLLKRLTEDRPVRVPTSPMVRVGVEKELCPNLHKLGAKVDFANDFNLYLTYKHRKSSIAGGDIEDMDFDEEYPNTGFLSMYREVDGRIPTPAIEIGASTSRYRHIGVCNIARASSIYGEQMRSMFGCGERMVQFGFDFSSLEARTQGHYILPFNGEELALQLLASKPNDIHTINAIKLGITRDQAKSISYMLMYGGSAAKARKMLNCSQAEAEALVQGYWDAVKPLSDLREAVISSWEKRGKKYVIGVDGRKIMTRSQHSLLNALFQSAGVICAKYSTVFIYQLLEDQGFNCNPFEHEVLDVCGMIEYHDECQLAVNPKLIQYKVFDSEAEAEKFRKDWTGLQLGATVHGNNGKFVIALPNEVSKAVEQAIAMAVKEVNLKVELGMEWVVHKNWFGCH